MNNLDDAMTQLKCILYKISMGLEKLKFDKIMSVM